MRNPQRKPIYGREFPSVTITGPLVISDNGDITMGVQDYWSSGILRTSVQLYSPEMRFSGTAAPSNDYAIAPRGIRLGYGGSFDFTLWSRNNANIVLSPNGTGIVEFASEPHFSGGTGTTKLFTYQNDSLGDDGTVNLPDATSGLVLVSCNAEGGMWLIQNDGTSSKIVGTANTANTDSDTNVCVYDGGATQAVVKNRLGVNGETRIAYIYN